MKILLLSTRFPLPARRGQQVRSLEWLEALKDYELRLLCPESPEADPTELIARIGPGLRVRCWTDSPLRRALAAPRGLLRGWPLQESIFCTAMARAILHTMLGEDGLALLIIQMVRCSWALDICRECAPGLPVLFDAIDSMGLHYARRAEGGGPGSVISRIEAQRCLTRERESAAQADFVTAVARRDLDFLQVSPERSRVIPVSGSSQTPPPDPSVIPPRLLLSGNLGYRPTVEGAGWFARFVWPHVKREFPALQWDLAGARPPRQLRRLARLDGVWVHANPESLDPYLENAGIAIAPMASGSGVPMKVLEAWAAGVPVVAHPWTLAGVEAEASEAALEAETPEQWIQAIHLLMEDAEQRQRLIEKGRQVWKALYHPKAVAEGILESVQNAIHMRETRQP